MSDPSHWQTILDIVTVCKRMWQKGWVANHDGNVSVKTDSEILATPTAVSKTDIIPEIILTLDMEGKKLAGPGKPFSEIQLHLAAYHARSDVLAVVHAHPPYATARGACGLPLNRSFIPEGIVSLGDTTPVAPYAMPGAPENVDIITNMLGQANAFMLTGNGVLAVGSNVMQAYLRIELVEHLAMMDFIANRLGQPFEIPVDDVAKLLEKRAAAGLAPTWVRPHPANVRENDIAINASAKGSDPINSIEHDRLRQMIAAEIKSILGN